MEYSNCGQNIFFSFHFAASVSAHSLMFIFIWTSLVCAWVRERYARTRVVCSGGVRGERSAVWDATRTRTPLLLEKTRDYGVMLKCTEREA